MANTEKRFCLAGAALILIYLLPSLVMGENHYILVHDFLDSTVAHIQSMKAGGALFDYDATMPILCGISRSVYGSFLDLKLLLFAVLPAYWAAIANIFLIKLTAFAGLFLLLSTYINPGKGKTTFINFTVSIIFAFVPFYPDYGISSSGVPLVAWAFLELFKRRHVIASFAVLVFYALFSWLVLSGVFVCFVMAAVILIFWIRKKRFPWLPFIGLCVLTAAYVAFNFQMFVTYFSPASEPSHRFDFAVNHFTLTAFLEEISVIFVSQYHAGTFLAVLILALFAVVWGKYRSGNRMLVVLGKAFLAGVSLIVISAVVKLTMGRFSFIREFQMDRFFFLYPALCFTMLGAAANELYAHSHVKSLKWSLLVLLLVNFAFDPHIRNNAGRVLGIIDDPSFRQFYDVALFDEIKDSLDIRSHDDKVACVGMYQAVAEYNDIYTVDGYIQLYPLSYKRKFQKVIQKELDKSETIRKYFCEWGERCYVFSSELGLNYMFGRNDQDKAIRNLEIDTAALAELGCRYILSSVPILNHEQLGLEFAGTFTHPDSYWQVSAYSLNLSL